MTLAKAITNGTVPMGAVAVRQDIYDTVTAAAADGAIDFFHGHTCSGHPLAVAAALATLRAYREDGLFERAAALAPRFLDAVFDLKGLPLVTDIRGYGLLAGIDLAPDGVPGRRGFAALKALFAAGLVARVTADTIILAPPFVATEADLDRLRDIIAAVLTDLAS